MHLPLDRRLRSDRQAQLLKDGPQRAPFRPSKGLSKFPESCRLLAMSRCPWWGAKAVYGLSKCAQPLRQQKSPIKGIPMEIFGRPRPDGPKLAGSLLSFCFDGCSRPSLPCHGATGYAGQEGPLLAAPRRSTRYRLAPAENGTVGRWLGCRSRSA